MNEQHDPVGKFARITRMALPEDQHLIGRIGYINARSIIDDELFSVLIMIDDTEEFVNAGDFEVLDNHTVWMEMERLQKEVAQEHYNHIVADGASTANALRGNEFEATINQLHKALLNIRTRAKEATFPNRALALDWIEDEIARVLVEVGLETETTLP